MNKIELLRMRWVFKKAVKAQIAYASVVKPETEAEMKKLMDTAVEVVTSLESLGQQEFTFVMSNLGIAVLSASLKGVEDALKRRKK